MFPKPKKSPRTSSIVQIIFAFWFFEISEDILRMQKFVIGLDSFSYQCLYMYLTDHFDSTSPYIDYPVESCRIIVILFGSLLPTPCLINMFTALKGFQF